MLQYCDTSVISNQWKINQSQKSLADHSRLRRKKTNHVLVLRYWCEQVLYYRSTCTQYSVLTVQNTKVQGRVVYWSTKSTWYRPFNTLLYATTPLHHSPVHHANRTRHSISTIITAPAGIKSSPRGKLDWRLFESCTPWHQLQNGRQCSSRR